MFTGFFLVTLFSQILSRAKACLGSTRILLIVKLEQAQQEYE
jgi:hypothetical protein